MHPAQAPHHELSLMCDDLEATVAELRSKGVEIKGEPHAEGFGLTTTIVLPGDLEMLLYEPRHASAI